MSPRESSYHRRRRRLRILLLLLLLLALALAGFLLYTYYKTKSVPLPSVEAPRPGQEIPPPRYLFSFDGGPGPNRLKEPLDVKVHPNGNVYVTDWGNKRVAVFDHDGNFLFSFRNAGPKNALNLPVYLKIDSKGRIYVTDRRALARLSKGAIYVFRPNGKYIREIIPNGIKQFAWKPMGLTFDKKGNLYVADILYSHRIIVLSPDDKIKQTFGSTGQAYKKGEKKGKLSFPNGILVDDNGDIYVSDSVNRRIQVFTKDGKFKRFLDTGGLPRGITFDHKKRIMVVDTLGHTVLVLNKKGKILTHFGERGFGPGQFQYPNGLGFSPPDRRIYVTDRENNRVHVWYWPPELPRPIRPVAKVCPWWWLPLLLLLLWYLWSRRKKHLLHEDFINAALETDKLELVVKKLKRLHVVEELYDRVKDIRVGEETLGDVLNIKDYYEDLVEEFQKELGLTREEAMVLSAAKKGIGRIILCAESEKLLDAAEDVGVRTMNFGEFIEKYEFPLR